MAPRRALVVAVLFVAALVSAPQAFGKITNLPARKGPAMGLIAHYGAQDPAAGSQTPVVYHGGQVMRGSPSVDVHLLYWAPSGFAFHSGYKALIDQFFADVAADNGATSNIFSVLPQFADGSGPGVYDISVDSISATDPFPTTNTCASPSGIPTCLTDHQVQAEVDKVIEASGGTLHRGLGDLYIVFLPENVDTCILPGVCGTNAFGGYHAVSNLGHGTTIYANVPDSTIAGTLPPNDTFPQGNSDAELGIDVAGHEAVEAMTDPLGSGWMDPNGFEVADKCEIGPLHGQILGQASNGADFNQVINGHDYLLQEMWSNDDGGCVQDTSHTASPLPLPQVTMSQFSSLVAGNIGSHNAVGVTVQVVRAGTVVASASTSSDAGSGNWIVSLGSQAVGDDRDEIDVHYNHGQPGAPPDQTILTGNGGNPNAEAGWTGWGDLDTGFAISPTGNELDVFPCFQTGVFTFTVGGASNPLGVCDTETDIAATPTALSAASPATLTTNDNRAFSPDNPNGALVSLSIPLGEPGGNGFPACSADLEAGVIACTGLTSGGHYKLTRTRWAANQTVSADSDDSGTLVSGFGGSPPLTGGDVVTLRNSASRVITTLHVAHLRVHLTGEETAVTSGHCEPGKYYGAFTIGPSTSPTAGGPGGPAGSGTICPLNGDASGLDAGTIAQTDDRSGGQTQTSVPDVEDTSPLQGESLFGAFTALAEAGTPGPGNSVFPSRDPISLKITRSSGGRAVFSSRNVNRASGVRVKALTRGTYRATWVVRTINGDTRTVRTRFIEQAGPLPPKAATASCLLSRNRIRCTVHTRRATTGTIRLRLSRGSHVLAIGHGRIRRGRVTLTMRTLGRVRRGRATLTIVVSKGRHRVQTVRLSLRLR